MGTIAYRIVETLQLGPFYADTQTDKSGWEFYAGVDEDDNAEERAWTLLYDVRRDMPELTRELEKNQPELWAADREEAEMILETLHNLWIRQEARRG